MKFREAQKKDIPQMFEIFKLNGSKYSPKLALKELNEMFSESPYKPTYIVAEEKKEILAFGGYIYSWIDRMVFNIFWMNVKPEYQGRGIGYKLTNELIKKIKKIKKPKAKMIILSTKIPSFYKKSGFKKMTKKYDRDYILMSLEFLKSHQRF